MKECPACGYKETASNKQLLRLYAKEFADLPVLAMMERGWISVQDREDINEIWRAILKFFNVESKEQLDQIFSDKAKFAAHLRKPVMA